MKIVVIFLIHFIIWTQDAETKDIAPFKSYPGHLSKSQLNAIYTIQSSELANLDVNRLLSISDLWDKIKNSVATAWNAIKDIATKTKKKINEWIQNIKNRADETAKVFEAKLEVLKEKLNSFIQTIKDIAGDVKKCIQDDKDPIQKLLKQIAVRVATCIADSVKASSALDSYQSRLALDDKEFIKGAEEKVDKCVKDAGNPEECLNKARGEIYDDMEHTENGIMDTRLASRDLAEDALETILQCAADGIIEASGAITEEVIKIITCVKSEKEKPNASY